MAVITDLIQDVVEFEAKKICKTTKYVEYGDLLQEGLLSVLPDSVKGDQAKAYYKKIAFRAMLKWVKKERAGGIVVNTYGGDRKSDTFKEQQSLVDNVHVVSLDALPTGFEISDEPLPFGKKATVPDYDDYHYPESFNDRSTDCWLRGKEI